MEITKQINSISDPNTSFLFNISDGKVTIDVMTNDIEMLNEEEDVVPDVIDLKDVFLRCSRYVTVVILDDE